MSRLSEYGGRIVQTDGLRTVEMVGANDNARRRFQYRQRGSTIERRVLDCDGVRFSDGSPWEILTDEDIGAMRAVGGEYHPILDEI